MRNELIANTLGTSLVHAQDTELDGLLIAVGEIAAVLHSVSGPPVAEEFLAQVRSTSLRLLQSGLDIFGSIGPADSDETYLMIELTKIEQTIGGSTAPSL